MVRVPAGLNASLCQVNPPSRNGEKPAFENSVKNLSQTAYAPYALTIRTPKEKWTENFLYETPQGKNPRTTFEFGLNFFRTKKGSYDH